MMNSRVAPYRFPVYIGCTVLALAINYLLGKDMAGDTLNYHLYGGFSAVNDRFAQDYFAAGPPVPTLLNPLHLRALLLSGQCRSVFARGQFHIRRGTQRHTLAYIRACGRCFPVARPANAIDVRSLRSRICTHQPGSAARNWIDVCRHHDRGIGARRLVAARPRGAHSRHDAGCLRGPSARYRNRVQADQRRSCNLPVLPY